MDWVEWLADQHIKAMIFAIAAGVILPYPLIAAQRPGRGIKPWWTTTRFLAWIGLAGAVIAVVTGQFLAKSLGHLDNGWIIRDEWSDLRIHQYLGGALIFLGYFCVRAVHARRKEHQGLGTYALITGLLWAAVAIGAGHYGLKLARVRSAKLLTTAQAQPQPEPAIEQPGRGKRIEKMLDYTALVPMHSEPVKSPPHKNRWIRVWVSQHAVEAYAKGESLPDGAMVVMNSVEERWGRPGYETGPLYSLDTLQGGKPRLGLYWSNVPESKRGEVDGLKNVNWLEPNPNLASCAECHSAGLSAPSARNRPRPQAPRRPSPEVEAATTTGGG